MHFNDVADEAATGNVAKLFDETARHHGDSLAIEASGHEITHAELRAASGAFAGGLRDRGFGDGDRILLYLPNCPQYLIAALGAFRAVVVVSPVNPQYKIRELAYQLEDTDADVVLTHPALREIVTETLAETGRDPFVVSVGGEDERHPDHVAFEAVGGEPVTVEREADDVALLPYTSGTTGRPKGVKLTHRNFSAQLLSYLASRSSSSPVASGTPASPRTGSSVGPSTRNAAACHGGQSTLNSSRRTATDPRDPPPSRSDSAPRSMSDPSGRLS
jgi:long-chain acyl-CoA synthetase